MELLGKILLLLLEIIVLVGLGLSIWMIWYSRTGRRNHHRAIPKLADALANLIHTEFEAPFDDVGEPRSAAFLRKHLEYTCKDLVDKFQYEMRAIVIDPKPRIVLIRCHYIHHPLPVAFRFTPSDSGGMKWEEISSWVDDALETPPPPVTIQDVSGGPMKYRHKCVGWPLVAVLRMMMEVHGNGDGVVDRMWEFRYEFGGIFLNHSKVKTPRADWVFPEFDFQASPETPYRVTGTRLVERSALVSEFDETELFRLNEAAPGGIDLMITINTGDEIIIDTDDEELYQMFATNLVRRV